MSTSGVRRTRESAGAARTPLEQLLHGLNQPLTGLQCSMEVALATPRTVDYYMHTMRDGLELTGRMRTLVNAIREVVDGDSDAKNYAIKDRVDLQKMLLEVMTDLEPVAEVKRVHLMLQGRARSGAWVKGGRPKLSGLFFRMLDSALSEAVRGSALRLEVGEGIADPSRESADEESLEHFGTEKSNTEWSTWFRMGWRPAERWAELSAPEMGLLVAQAGWEQMGAEWVRERGETMETVTVRLPGLTGEGDN